MQSTIHQDYKSFVSFIYYSLLLVIYLHVSGCLLFYYYLATYEISTTKFGILEGLGIWSQADNGEYVYKIADLVTENPSFTDQTMIDYYKRVFMSKAELINVLEDHGQGIGSSGRQTNDYPAWVPAYDNYDGSESFWCIFEKTRLGSPETRADLFGLEPD